MTTRVPKEFGVNLIGAGLMVVVGPVPTGRTWYVSKLDLYNAHTSDVVVQVYIDQDGTPRKWKRVNLDAEGGNAALIDNKAVLLETAGRIMATASVHSQVTFVSNGIEETP